MKLPIKTIALFFLLAASANAEQPWKSLFDGTTLSGWEARADGDVKVVEKEIRLLSKKANLWLIHEATFEDFELEVEALMPADGYNSGIGFRCQGAKKPKGYQCEIENQKSGSLYAIGKGWVFPKKGDQKAFQEAAKNVFKLGKWNRFRIRCKGDHLQIWLNDIKLTDIHDSLFKSGSIALQHHGKGEVHRFRNIRIREI